MNIAARIIGVALIAITSLSAVPAWATDWVADKLRGPVHFLSDGEWQELVRGDELPDGVILRTGTGGRVELRRGKEVMNLGANTQIRVVDKSPAEKFTNVYQDFGTLDVDVERRNVRHFAVITRQLAAVVKGTRFSVDADEDGAMVKVERGVVQVQDAKRRARVDIRPGQQAGASEDTGMSLEVDGEGNLPAVVDMATGKPLDPGSQGNGNGAANAPGQLKKAADNTVDALTGNSNGNPNSNGNGDGNGNGNSNSNGNGGGNGGGNGNSGGSGNGGGQGNGNGNGVAKKLTDTVGGLL